jgi:hypothetical protein
MSHEAFVHSLGEFGKPHLHREIHKALSNTFLQTEHKTERIGLFLEKKRNSVDLKSFSFNGKNSFSGRDVLVPQNDGSPLSLYLSGTLDEISSRYSTNGLTFGWDYANGTQLMGMNLHFKNKPLESFLYHSHETQEYVFDFYNVHRGAGYFVDYSFGGGHASKDVKFDNIWGDWDSKTKTSKISSETRLGIYTQQSQNFTIGYLGLSGSYATIPSFSSKTADLDITTTQSSLLSLDGKIGTESKTKFHIENISIEPSIQAALSIPLWENYNAPSNSFGSSPITFPNESFSLSKTALFLKLALNIHPFHNTLIKLEAQTTKQWEEFNSKILLDINVRF